MVHSVSIAGGAGNEKIRAFFTLREDRRQHRLAFILFWSILMYYLVQGYVVSAGLIVDKAMHPSVPDGGYYLVNKYIYHFASPDRGDIVVFKRTRDATKLDAKRIIGLPGETVLIKSGDVYVDGHRLNEPYAVGRTYPDRDPYTVAEGTYYVLADNRMVIEDSRYFGPIPLKKIEGKMNPGEIFPFF